MGITEKELQFLQEKAAYIRKEICITANKVGTSSSNSNKKSHNILY
jgi:hypothetical protein